MLLRLATQQGTITIKPEGDSSIPCWIDRTAPAGTLALLCTHNPRKLPPLSCLLSGRQAQNPNIGQRPSRSSTKNSTIRPHKLLTHRQRYAIQSSASSGWLCIEATHPHTCCSCCYFTIQQSLAAGHQLTISTTIRKRTAPTMSAACAAQHLCTPPSLQPRGWGFGS
jgi:hypothetical protein